MFFANCIRAMREERSIDTSECELSIGCTRYGGHVGCEIFMSSDEHDKEPLMNQQTDRPTPPIQTPEDPNMADRRLSDEQKRTMRNEPEPPKRTDESKEEKLPNPKDVGEAG
ncbi:MULTISPECIES: hypothetical protein [unclassified Caballeronia]|uniref:hypothetical protein n=3 Tax=Caballeronia TaxID=1827195 RepID=UPI002027A37D|nr:MULTISPECIES: hypothetical protein [unclassified Caballeronia]